MALDIYQRVTDRILELLDQGTVPWRQPIKRTTAGDGFPKSLNTGRAYRGINVFLLAATAWIKGYESNYWLTFKQAEQRGAKIRRGEKSSLVVFWKQYAVADRESGEDRQVPVLRHYNVFNADQCDGIEPPDRIPPDDNTPPFEPIEAAQRIVDGYPNPPTIQHGGSRAFYRASTDTVQIAVPERFEARESYYVTLFHELTHASGHSKRLNRGLDEQPHIFGSPDYSKEELVAELGAAFLAATAGISPPTIEQSAAYIQGWSKKLQSDKKLIVQAAGAAQRAADHVLGVKSYKQASTRDEVEPFSSPFPRLS